MKRECSESKPAANRKINVNFKKQSSIVHLKCVQVITFTAEKKMQHIKAEENFFLIVAFFLVKCTAINLCFLKLRLSLMRYMQPMAAVLTSNFRNSNQLFFGAAFNIWTFNKLCRH